MGHTPAYRRCYRRILHFSRKEKPAEEFAIVATMKAEQNDVGVYGEYVGRIRAQQFVEVHARVEGFLEQMLFEEGTYVKKTRHCLSSTNGNIRQKSTKPRPS